MKNINTKYGALAGITSADYYEDQSIKECKLNIINRLDTPYGILVPQYEDSGERRKHIASVSFHNNGNLKSISLQNQVKINTSMGILSAEFVTFYENGNINRLFPLNGKLTAYWSEKDEGNLAEDVEFNLPIGKFKQKIIAVHFYETGAIKSITFWPKDTVSIDSPFGSVEVRIGLSLYPDGSLKSFEPNTPISIKTEIGIINAYDIDAVGIHGDSNSIKLSAEGTLEALITSTDKVEIVNKNGERKIFSPGLKKSIINEDGMDIIPLNIEFHDNIVRFNNNIAHEYSIDSHTFIIHPSSFNTKSPCATCTACTGCNGCSG